MVKIQLRDDIREYENGVTPYQIAESISAGLARVACAAKIDGKGCDLRTPIENDCAVEILTFDDPYGKKAFWHSTSHVLAQAVKRLFPDVKLTIGPAIDEGFYYDFDSEEPFTPDVLEKLEAEMKKIVKENEKIERFTLPREEAIAFMKERNEPYKVELIEDLPEGEVISFYRQGEFVDLCAGPHLMSTGTIKAFKLTQCNSAYWRGDAKNKTLQRVYGIS